MNVGSAELVIVLLAVLPSLLGIALAVWLLVTTLTLQRRVAHLEHRLRALEHRSGPGE